MERISNKVRLRVGLALREDDHDSKSCPSTRLDVTQIGFRDSTNGQKGGKGHVYRAFRTPACAHSLFSNYRYQQ
jgi:hypothetical protein